MKHILLVLMLGALALPCFAQEEDIPAETTLTNRVNEFNLGYFNIFNLSESVSNFGLGYKRTGETGAIRLGLSMNLELQKSGVESQEDYKSENYGFSPRAGYEFHQDFKRLRLYYGADLVGSLSWYEYGYYGPGGSSDGLRKTERYSVGLRPLLGLTYFFHPAISISTETGLLLAWTLNKASDEGEVYNRSSGLETSGGKLGTISLNFHF